MHLQRFMIGDKVSYAGKKFASDLRGKLGVVLSRVQNSEDGIVCSFGDKDAYVLDETKHLSPFHGKVKEEGDHEPKGPPVEKRKGVGAGRKRVVDQEAND